MMENDEQKDGGPPRVDDYQTDDLAVQLTVEKLKRRVADAYQSGIMELMAEGVRAPVTVALLIAHGEIARIAGETINALMATAAAAREAENDAQMKLPGDGIDKPPPE